ncbi:hypothetical protein EDF42_1900 [Curtobacterium sp. PhB172]|uniref:hypothetical protein n=1 Tax=Curtobacterium TaxID=2034 RepID=UPI000FAD5412|nr:MULTISPECIES: hypothetical protein [Curtobacterium]MBF4605036.1 hypothetical protein [Curtobacterium sp. VKM Ac-2884]MBT1623751.1 hypothetical protein [Curtobacterium flaccumfaciens pv. oortii]ROS65476.1 hypothetical protein EDF42_1900 [Curtobacterium sp. PhB172]
MTRIARSFGMTLAAGVAAVGIAVLPAVSASAATAVTNDYGASLSVSGPASVVTDGSGALHGVSDGTVTVTGSGFDGDAQGRGFGVYVVYGPKQADYATNSGWFGSAQWVSKSAFTAGGGFTTTIDVAKSYTADPHHTGDAAATVSCDYDATKTATANAALGQYECFVQTFSAHGVANDPVDLDEVQVPVTW